MKNMTSIKNQKNLHTLLDKPLFRAVSPIIVSRQFCLIPV